MISRTTASTPPPPPPPVSTTVVCSRVTSSRSSAIGNSPLIALLLWRNERTFANAVPNDGDDMHRAPLVIVTGLTLAACNQTARQRPAPSPAEQTRGIPRATES